MTSASDNAFIQGWSYYPKFRRIDDIGRDPFESYVFSMLPHDGSPALPPSDYIWLSLMAWCPNAEAAIFEEGVVLRLPKYHGDNIWLTSFCGASVPPTLLDELSTNAALGGRLHYVPEWTIHASNLGAVGARVVRDEDNDDYVYDVEEQLAAFGHRFEQIRHERNLLARKGRSFRTTVVLDINTATGILTGVFDTWLEAARSNGKLIDLEDERRAFSRLLSRKDLERCSTIILEIDEVVAGFTINEVLPDGTAVCHFTKAIDRSPGVWQLLRMHTFEHLASLGVRYWNFEQDLGVPGLRVPKLRDRPVCMVPKYVVEIAQ